MARHDDLVRRKPFRQPLPRILIVCEGTKTEPGYFNHLRQLYRRLIEVEISPGGTPRTLVQRAAEMKKAAEREARRDANLLFEEVWCVFDVDEHPFLPEAKQQARDNQIEVAISNPCFELWILLHFRDQRASIDRADLHRECREFLPGYEKAVPCDTLHAHYAEALQRALELAHWQETRGTPDANPSTGVHLLTERIKSFGSKRD
jgi:hypothetical protein